MSQQGNSNVGKSYLQEVLVLWSSSCNNKSSAQLQITISRVGETSCPKENAARHMNAQLKLMQIAVLNTSMWSTRLTLAVCTTHVPTPEEPACTRTRLPDLMFQSDIACMQASDHLPCLHVDDRHATLLWQGHHLQQRPIAHSLLVSACIRTIQHKQCCYLSTMRSTP